MAMSELCELRLFEDHSIDVVDQMDLYVVLALGGRHDHDRGDGGS